MGGLPSLVLLLLMLMLLVALLLLLMALVLLLICLASALRCFCAWGRSCHTAAHQDVRKAWRLENSVHAQPKPPTVPATCTMQIPNVINVV